MNKKRVVIGMSGGVDSSVAAKLLIENGYDVIGLFMHNWEEDGDDGACCAAADFDDARAVSAKLGIPCYSVNFAAEYQERVFAYFLDAYKKGRTPNPDVLCNREIKFGPFSRYAQTLGAEFIATGHYCGIKQFKNDTHLLKARDTQKDQTYFLNQVKTKQLSNVLFPLANLHKSEVRQIAKTENLVTAKKKDSTGICFIGERKFKKFLQTYLPAQSGDIVDASGRVLGTHDGLLYYTLGQRKGFGLGGIAGEGQNRWYVIGKDLAKNRLIVSNGEGEELFSSVLTMQDVNYIGTVGEKHEFRAAAKCRYRQEEQPCTVFTQNNKTTLRFDTPQRAVTPGQYAVLYQENRCLGGGVIV
ncbi:MAG: tRNA 2-thiouridine(34) synthase MnmA [Firmicutes bacterium]|nr:tRNA 2-thiouridine(34) synthase MnmA [Bacillota bacterium]